MARIHKAKVLLGYQDDYVLYNKEFNEYGPLVWFCENSRKLFRQMATLVGLSDMLLNEGMEAKPNEEDDDRRKELR